MGESSIEWTDATWNPVRGCTKISPGCKRCYAETFAERFRGVPGHPYEQGFNLRLVPEKLADPLRWKRHRRVFVNSMSDLFHKDLPREYVAAVFGVMAAAQQHTFQVLTKRADVMLDFMRWMDSFSVITDSVIADGVRVEHCIAKAEKALGRIMTRPPMFVPSWPLPNVWLGVSVEDRKYGLPRIEHLRTCPAAVRFLSVEPLLEDLGEVDLSGISWVIVGGESGPKARGCNLEWVRSIVRQCREAGVPCFVKQDSGPKPGMQGRIDNETWAVKEYPHGAWRYG